MDAFPSVIEATGTDSAVSITREVTRQRVGIRLAFDGPLDVELLRRAVRLSIDAEPVLGCSWDTSGFRPCWRRLASIDPRFFSAKDAENPEADVDAFLTVEVPDAGPQVEVALFRHALHDELGIKLSHVVADGRAVKQYAYLLADLYSRLKQDAGYRPEANTRPRPTGRDVWEALSPTQRRAAKKAKSWANPTWEVPRLGTAGQRLRYRKASLAPDEFSAVKAYGRLRDATVNDLLVTAFFRACVDVFQPPVGERLSVMCTADLRRFLPQPDALPVANMSISGPLELERVAGELFDDTLRRVREQISDWAEQSYGAAPVFNAERLARLGYSLTRTLMHAAFTAGSKGTKTYPWLTNIGVIDERRLAFGDDRPSEAHMYGPVAPGASLVPTISTYRNRLTLCMGYCEGDFDVALVDVVLHSTIDELVALTRPSSPVGL